MVLDGVTARTETGCVHGAAWLARQLGAALLCRLGEPDPLVSVLAAGIAEVAGWHGDRCDLTHPGTPSAAVGVVRFTSAGVEYAVLGDVTVVAETRAGELVVVADQRSDPAAAAEREAATALPYGSPERAAALVGMKHAEHAARNRAGGFWVAAADPAVAGQAIVGTVDDAVRVAVLSDGAARAVHLFGLCDWPGAVEVLAGEGSAGLIARVREAETADPGAVRWPRTKRSDDATVAWAELGVTPAEP